ncbi:trypsin-like serine peptidase [Streptodolium elevatio]|uniref:Uncharacterized protein n=1 Tax=Streptodolium elevatio TaxID=3157996 RepID=A0ABV3DGT2_9ACTN
MYTRTSTVGRLWYIDPIDSSLHSCTGSVVTNGNRSTVLTAVHGVHGGEGEGWFSEILFVPGYSASGATKAEREPYGRWWPYSAMLAGNWADSSPEYFDYAFITVWNLDETNTSRIQDLVGSQGWIFNSPEIREVEIQGYPIGGNSQTNGGEMEMYTAYAFPGGNWMSQAPDVFESDGGDSGSAWLMSFDYTTYLGWATSVTAKGASNDTVRGPYFDDDFATLIDWANIPYPE